MEKYGELRAAVAAVPAVDAHAHNVVAIDSSFPFLRCFSEAEGDALSFAPHSLSFKRSVRDLAELYNCEATLDGVEAYRKSCGLTVVGTKCFEAANVSVVFIDDGITFDKMHDWEWHGCFGPAVGRVLRIEHLAETILNEEIFGDASWSLKSFTEIFLKRMKSVGDNIVALKSIAAYRSGLQLDTKVSIEAAEEGLYADLRAGRPVRIKNKSFIDYLFTKSLEVALFYDLPIQIHTGSMKEEMVLADMQIKPGEAWEYCPRNTLREVAKILKDEFNLVMNAGFENEFYLLKSIVREGIEQWVPFDLTPYCSTSAFDAASPILQEVHLALQFMDIFVEQLHAESGKGQFELALGHKVCTLAADSLIFVREVIRAAARKHGLLATFVPKYCLDDIGSGSHVHLSLWENGVNVFMGSEVSNSQYGMSKVGECFMAGVLNHLPSILAFTAPLPNSYDRIQPNTWSGAYQCWGKENREAPLRTACPPGVPSGLVSNFEVKTFDGCANPHLGLASIIAAGIDGLRRNLSLPKPIEINPSYLGSEIPRLPNELRESVEALEKDQILRDLIGEKLVTSVLAIRKAEIDYYGKNKDAYKQLIHKY